MSLNIAQLMLRDSFGIVSLETQNLLNCTQTAGTLQPHFYYLFGVLGVLDLLYV